MNLGHHLSVRLRAFASCCITRAEIIIKKRRAGVRGDGGGGGGGVHASKNLVWIENFIQPQTRLSFGAANKNKLLTHNREEWRWDAVTREGRAIRSK